MSWPKITRGMLRAWWAAALFCVGWPLLSPGQSPPPSDEAATKFTISADVNLVLLDVSVRDTRGGFVSGLTRDNFTVYEDGHPQKITQFADQDIPVTIGLLVDNSGSMRPKKPEVITAALVLIQASNPRDEVFVVDFNDTVQFGLPESVPFTDDTDELRQALVRTDPAGRTALYDAIIAGLKHLDAGHRDKKTLVVVSDGGDNISSHSFHQTLDAVLASRATIYTIGVFNEDDQERNPGVLKKLAHVSGGVCYLPKKLDEVPDICRQIAKDVRTRYTIGYIPHDLARAGVRHIKVEARASGHGKLVARTRTRYVVKPTLTSGERKKQP